MNTRLHSKLLFAAGLSLTLGLTLGLSACGGNSSSASNGASPVYFIFNGYTPPYFAPMAQGIKDAAKFYPDLNIKTVSANASAETEISDINTAVAAHAKAIILNAIDESVTQAAKQAMDKGIPVITIDRDISDPSGRFAFIGDNDQKLGQQETTSCLEGLKASGLPKPWHTVILEGTLGASTAVDRVTGTTTTLKGNSDVDVILNQSADFDTAKAQALMNTELSKTTNVQAVIAGNDAMALGVINALKSHGLTAGKNTIVCGVDAQPESLTAIKAGTQYNTVTHSPYLEAFWAVEAVDNYLKNKTKPPSSMADGKVLVPQEVITKSNLSKFSAWGTPQTVPPLPYGFSKPHPVG